MMKQDDDHNGKDKPRPFSFSFRIKMLILMVLLPVVVLSRFFIETPRQSIFPFSEQSKTDAQLLLYEKIKDSQLKTTAGNAKNDEWTPCWKLCPSRRNKIVYSFPGKAGLNDRFYIFYRLINMAGYLCATVIVPKPRDLLAEWHNDGKQVAPLSEWNDFRLTQWRMNTNMNGTYSFETSPILTAHSLTNIRSYLSEERKTASLFLTMSEKDQGWDQFHRLENYTLKQPKSGNDYFVWNLNSFFYESDLFWIPENTTMSLSVLGNPFPRSFPSGVPWWQWTGCEYYESTTPKHIQTIANNIWKEVKSVVDDATIGSFHIRRGDMKHECNTTLPKMKSYVSCSFTGSAVLGNITLLLSTDETDEIYLGKVKGMIEAYPHVKVRSLDELAWKHTQLYVDGGRGPKRLLNNYVVFNVMDIIRFERVAFTIEQRRYFACPDCEELVKMEKVQWVGASLEYKSTGTAD